MNILGINAYHGDASACLLIDGEVQVAIEEERLRRIKHWAGFPELAIRACLAHAGMRAHEIDHVALGRRPTANLPHKVAYALRRRPALALLRDRLGNLGRLHGLRERIAAALDVEPSAVRARLHHVEHHVAHLASSYYGSPCDTAVCASIDGFGDFASTAWGVGEGSLLRLHGRVLFPHSLGAFYTAGTQYLGFDRFGDEYKVMGLAPYGEPRQAAELRELIRIGTQGRFRLDPAGFRHPHEVVDTRWDGCAPELAPYFSEEWPRRFGAARGASPLAQEHRDLARSLQTVFEEVYFHVIDHAATLAPARDLCLAGGCAFNGVANGALLRRGGFRSLHVHPAAGDAGTAVGAALWVWHQKLGRTRRHVLEHAFLGTAWSDAEIRRAVEGAGLDARWIDDDARVGSAVEHLVAGEVVGWFHGRSEWGPRALGNRSILADPRRAELRDALNDKIKRRESFRPFAPAGLAARAGELFETGHRSPFMNQVHPVRPAWRERLAAVTHVDGSARLQTVEPQASPLFHRLIEAFEERTGVPALLNTSFNEGEPIVHTPEEALACFRRTGMDALFLGRAVLRKQAPAGTGD